MDLQKVCRKQSTTFEAFKEQANIALPIAIARQVKNYPKITLRKVLITLPISILTTSDKIID